MSGSIDYIRRPLPDKDYDLQPLVLEKPTAHALNDDVILNIFGFLPFRELVSIERVCRRWRCLVYSSFRRRTRNNIEKDIESWMIRNKTGKSIQEFTKVLIFGGKSISRIIIESDFTEGNYGILRIIGQLCPNLKLISVVVGSNHGLKAVHFKELGTLCTKLEEFIVNTVFEDYLGLYATIPSDAFSAIISEFPELRILRLHSVIVEVNCLSNLPKHLKELRLNCSSVRHADDSFEPFQEDYGFGAGIGRVLNASGVLMCPELEIFILDGTILSASTLNDIGRNCKNLCNLRVIVKGYSEEVNWRLFQNLEVLSCDSFNLNLEQMLQLPKLEELVLSGWFKENAVYDFSQLQNLKRFDLSNIDSDLNLTSLQTILKCKNLELFKYSNQLESKFLLKLIQKCSILKLLDVPAASIKGTDINDFVQANKGRRCLLQFDANLDQSASRQIGKLREANYEMFGYP